MGGMGLPAELLAREGIDTMICSGLGRRAIGLFKQHAFRGDKYGNESKKRNIR